MILLSRIKFKLFQKKYRRLNTHNETIIMNYCDLSKVIVGKKTYGPIQITDASPKDTKLKIGSYCSIAQGVQFLLGGEHQINSISTYPFKVKCFGQKREAGSKGDIVVKDDGIGFDIENGKEQSFGIIGMRERIDLLEGQMHIHSVIGKGTTILFKIPFPKEK